MRHRPVNMLALAAVAAVLLATAAVASAYPSWPKHRCTTFRQWVPPSYGEAGFYYHISVYNGHVGCTTAPRVIRAFWSGKGVHHGGPSDAQSWWTLRGLPGWSCRQGAGAGSCVRGRAIAAYEVAIPSS